MQTVSQDNFSSNSALDGTAMAYEEYREHFKPETSAPVHWRWGAIADKLNAGKHGERGSLTLSLSGAAQDCELLPGMAINVQVVPNGGRTRAHAHSWWHLFFVRSGSARAHLRDQEPREIEAGDVLLVPAWTDHFFINESGSDLVLLSMSNLPQQAALANHLAREPDEAKPPPVDTNKTEK